MIKKWLSNVWLKSHNFIEQYRRAYETEWVEDLPENPARNTIYIIGGRKYPYYAVVLCSRKKCNEMIHLAISPEFKKRWRYEEHSNGRLTLHPSIYLTKSPCRCHYWIREGHIVWSKLPLSPDRH